MCPHCQAKKLSISCCMYAEKGRFPLKVRMLFSGIRVKISPMIPNSEKKAVVSNSFAV